MDLVSLFASCSQSRVPANSAPSCNASSPAVAQLLLRNNIALQHLLNDSLLVRSCVMLYRFASCTLFELEVWLTEKRMLGEAHRLYLTTMLPPAMSPALFDV